MNFRTRGARGTPACTAGAGGRGTHRLNPCDRSGRRVAELSHGNGCRRASCQQPAPSRLRKETCSEAALPRGETEARTGRSARGPRGPDSAGTPAGWPRAACGSLPPAPKCAMLPLTRPRSAHEPGGRCAVTGRSLAERGPVNAGTVTLSRSWAQARGIVLDVRLPGFPAISCRERRG